MQARFPRAGFEPDTSVRDLTRVVGSHHDTVDDPAEAVRFPAGARPGPYRSHLPAFFRPHRQNLIYGVPHGRPAP
jgi:hypothetical protein